MLPKGVEKVTARGRTYYYWHPDRGTAREGKRVRLPNAETEPAAFWKEIELYSPKAPAPDGSVSFLVRKYRASEDFKRAVRVHEGELRSALESFRGGMGQAIV